MLKKNRILAILSALCMGTLVVVAVAASPEDTSRTDYGQFTIGSPAPENVPDTNQNIQNAKRIESFKLIKRDIDYKEQMTIAVSMMAFIALMFFSSQTLNPG